MHWLYRYVFKGFGLLMLLGMITGLILGIQFVRNAREQAKAPAHLTAPR